MSGEYPLEMSNKGGELARAPRQKIKDVINKPERELLSLKVERNEQVPISILPPEVLSKIFTLVRNQSTGFQYRAPWLCVGQVCHRWREVALGYPSLWSTPVFAIPDLARGMMQRSKTAALTITFSNSSPRGLKELENAMSQIHRIQSIYLSLVYHFQTIETLLSPLSQSAPLLESFAIYVAFPGSDDGLFPFPTDILSDAPRLRSISLHGNLNFSWESTIFRHRSLTDLCLSSLKNIYGNSSFSQMVDTLYDLPNLRTLKLDGSIPPYTTSNGNEKIIEFNFLERLELGCTFLFQHIRYPPHAVVLLYCRSTGPRNCRTLFSLINSNLHHTRSVKVGVPQSPVIIRSLRLNGMGSPEITFRKDLQYPTRPFIRVNLHKDHYPSNQSWVSLLPAISDGFSLSSIQDLFLDWNLTDLTDSQRDMIRDFFKKLPELKILRVSSSNLREICFAIAESPEDSLAPGQEETQTPDLQQRTSSPVAILPALSTLEIVKMGFRNLPEKVERLIDMLIKRSNMNAPIDRLSIKRWVGRRARQTRLLGELVNDLEIEGRAIIVNELDSDDDQESEDEYIEESDGDLGNYSDEYHTSNDSEISWGP